MDIQKMVDAYQSLLNDFDPQEVLNVYEGQRHTMLVREKDIARVFSSSTYQGIKDELQISQSKMYPFDSLECYEKELEGK